MPNAAPSAFDQRLEKPLHTMSFARTTAIWVLARKQRVPPLRAGVPPHVNVRVGHALWHGTSQQQHAYFVLVDAKTWSPRFFFLLYSTVSASKK
jgi:hypothetical protein